MPDERSDPRDTFSGSADRYLNSTDHQSGPDLEVIRQVAARRFPVLTVDVATGAGHAIRAAYPYSGSCAALDMTMEMLKVAREHLGGAGHENVRYIQSTADQLPLSGGDVSLLTCRIAPHHFASVTAFLREVARVLEPGGIGIIIDSIVPDEPSIDQFINDTERQRDPSHVRSHTLKQWMEKFETAGLGTVSVELFERRHPFREWAARTGLDEHGIMLLESKFKGASPQVKERLKVELDDEGGVSSYTDEKGIFVVRKEE